MRTTYSKYLRFGQTSYHVDLDSGEVLWQIESIETHRSRCPRWLRVVLSLVLAVVFGPLTARQDNDLLAWVLRS